MRALPGKAGEKEKIIRPPRLSLIPLVFILDRLSKIWVVDRFREGEGFSVLPGFFRLTRVNNTGAAFGLFKNGHLLLAALSVACIGLLCFYGWRQRAKPQLSRHRFGLILVVGGALGNLYDRLTYGYVVDFLDFRVWPVFNLADSCITVGMLILFAGIWFQKE